MRIAFFSPAPFSKKLGATKNRIEMAEVLSKLGWETFLIGNEELGLPLNKVASRPLYREHFKNYLIANAHQYDVIIYEYDTLPFDRNLFSKDMLLVARPALLHYHFDNVKIPHSFRAKVSNVVRKLKVLLGMANPITIVDEAEEALIVKSLTACDVIQVQNTMDLQLLVAKNYSKDKIIVVPNGISAERLTLFSNYINNANINSVTKIAFVGGFDFRKGAMDFPYIISTVLRTHPDCKFKLIGSKGIFHTEEKLLQFFPKHLRHAIEIVQTFEPQELPELLSDCSVGIFPSYIESFGFGALEMMAAGLPVVSYNSPGPKDFIIEELLVNVGDKKALADKLLKLLKDPVKIKELSLKAQTVAKHYNWDRIGDVTSKQYTNLHHQLKAKINI